MKIIQNKQECIGKTVKAIQQGDSDEQIVVVFDDDTFLSLRSRRAGDEFTEIEIQTRFDPFDWQFPDMEAAFGYDNAKAMHEAEAKRREETNRRWKEDEKARLRERLRQIEDGE